MKRTSLLLSLLVLLASSLSHAAPPEKVDVVIVGAGLSGLAAAYELKKLGLSYHILELSPRIGGRVRTIQYNFPGEKPTFADSGMEEYWESNPAVQILKELKLPISHDVAISSIVLDKKLYALGDEEAEEYYARIFSKAELKAFDDFKKKMEPLVHKIKNAWETLPEKPMPAELLKLKDKSFADYVKSFNLPSKVNEWVRVSVECEIGTRWERIAALDGIAEFHIFVGKGEEAFRVTGGNEAFVKAFANAIGLSNISLNKRVNRIARKGGVSSVSYIDQETHQYSTIEAPYVITTVPLFRAVMEIQFEPAISAKKMEAIQRQTWGSYFKAHVFVPMSAEKYWTKNGSSYLPVLSDSNLGVIYDGNRDQEGVSTKIISLLITGDDAERMNMMPQDLVRKEIYTAFDKLWPGFSKEIKGVEFFRLHPRAIAAWPPGRSRYDDLSNEIRKPENGLHFAGDFTETSHSDGSFLSAKRAVRQIVAARKKK